MGGVRNAEIRHRVGRGALALVLALAVVVAVQSPALAVAPVVTAAADDSVAEGTEFSGTVATFDDPDGPATFTATIDWGDGTAVDDCSTAACTLNDNGDGTGSIDGAHTYADDGSYTVTITVSDGTDPGSDTLQMTVTNVAPSVTISGAASVAEGTSYTLTVGAVTDPGDDTISNVTVDWGDGSSETVTAPGSPTHTYDDNATPTITIDLTDEDGTYTDVDTLPITVTNVTPTVTAPASASITEGDTLTSQITFTDPGSADTHEARVNYGEGAGAGSYVSVTSPFNLNNLYEEDGSYNVTVQVRDDELDQGSDSFTVTVANADPVVSARGNATVENGGTVFLGGSSFTDAGTADTHTATVNWGDGSPTESATVTQAAGSGTLSGNHTFASGGPYTVTIEVTDDDGGSDTDTFTVTVQNSAFTVNAGSNQSVDEGDTVNVSATFDDTDGAGTHTATINWGDGTTDDCSTVACTISDNGDGTGSVTGSHVYPDNDGSPWTVTVTVDDETGDTANDSLNVTVANVEPSVTLTGAASVNEGSVYSLTISAVTDPGDDTVTDWIVDWGDGTSQTFAAGGMRTHTYADGVTNPTITIDLVDEDGTYTDVDTLPITVNNVAPTISLSGDEAVDEGSLYTLTLGAVTDPGDDTPTSYTINWGDGTTPQVVGTAGDVTHTYADGDATPTISVSVTDEDGTHAGAGTLDVTVNNVAPSVTAPATATIAEGATLGSSISFTDPGNDTHEARVDYGEGAGFGSWGSVTSPFSLSNLYEEDSGAGTYTVTIEVRDDDGTVGSATIDLTVTNANPVVTARDDDTINDGQTIFIGGGGGTSFTDAGTLDTHTATIDWDDGDGPEAANVTGGTVTFPGGHTYNTPGTYTVTVEVTDDDGGVGTDTFTVNVTNSLFEVIVTPTPPTPVVIDEGDGVSISATYTDADGAGTHTATIDWGDGTVDDCATAACGVTDNGDGTGTVTGSHTYPQDGSFTVEVTVTDTSEPIDVGTNGFTATVQNVAPSTAIAGPTTADEGDGVALFGNPTDPGVEDVLTYQWEVTKDGSPFKSGTNRNILFTPDDNGEYVASYTVTDDDESSPTEEWTVTVSNVDPIADIVDEGTGDPVTGITDIGVEGSTITLGAAITDPGSADTFTYDWEITQPGSPPITGSNPTISFVSPDNGLFFVNLTIADDDGGEFSPSSPIIQVTNGDPFFSSVVTDPTPGVGATVNLSVGFDDPGSADTHDVTIDWGDGDSDTDTNASSPATFTHSFSSAGARSAEVCVVDDDGGEACATWYYNVGASLSTAADYDGDGFEDLAVGVPGEDSGGGGVHVIYGSGSGLTGAGDQFLQPGVGGVVGALEAGDAFGAVIAHGDFNGDGYTDLAIGAPGEDMSGLSDVGNVTVIYGSPSGLDTGTDQVWHQDRSGVPDANESGDGWGQALATGDFNGDAFADLAIGAPFENVGGVSDAGRVTVLFGSPGGLTTSGSVFFDQDVAGMANQNKEDDHFGAALAGGDFNGDGFDDLAAGVPGQVVGGGNRAGAVAIVPGGLIAFDIGANTFLHQQTAGVLGDPNAGDELGSVVESGDLNGDGFDDLVLGIPSEAVNSKADAGVVAVLPGSGAGPTGAGDVQFREGGTMLGNAVKKDAFGASVAVGDVTGDGIDDLVVGIPNQKISGNIQAGAVAFVPGSPSLSAVGNSRWHEDKANILGTAQKADHLGTAVAIVDTDGDGNGDLALGIPDQNRQGRKDVGAVLVIRGGNSGPVKAGDSYQWQGQNGLTDNTQKFDRFGAAM